jgi:prolyl-tRNA synthetase
VLECANEIKDRISKVARVKLDDSDKMPGWKFNEYEMKGIPVRVEIGPKDIEQNQAVLVRRDTREKIQVSLDEIDTKVTNLLIDIHNSMLDRAKELRDGKTYTAASMEELKDLADNKPGFIKAMWCGKTECEEKVKENAGLSSRCMPFEQEHIADTCVCCGEKAEQMVYWGKAY